MSDRPSKKVQRTAEFEHKCDNTILKMGVGNRMKKQGPPPSLDEFLNSKKRKGGSDQPTSNKKRRPNVGSRKPNVSNKVKPIAKHPGEKISGAEAAPTKTNGKLSGKAAKAQLLDDADDDGEAFGGFGPESGDAEDETQDDIDGIDDPDIMEDEFDTAEADRLEAAESSEDTDVVDSDEEQRQNGGIWSDEDDEEAEDLDAANMEGMSRHLDEKSAQEAAEAQAELEEAAIQTNIAGDAIPELDDDDEDAEPGLKTRIAPDLQLLRTRITDTIRVLDDFSKHSSLHPDRSRADYVRQLLRDICAYYGYSSFLAEKLFNLFPPREAFDFFEANETPRPVVIRTNTLRTHRRELAQSLINRGVTLEPVGKWSKVGLQIFESGVPLGATPEYLAGQYIMQAASSFLPVMALAPQEHERVLDMASAPGGKTTHIAALMRNTGVIFANDSNKVRAKALIGNIHRLGAKNTIVCNYDALEFPKVMGGFDRVLLDAPCSGTGVIAKDASVKTNKTEKDFIRLPELQKKLLLAAIDSVDHASKTGGYIVYSTCSVTVEENEAVVNYALTRRPNVKLVETGLVIGREGFVNYMGRKFSPSMKMTRRYYPHLYNVDGFFVSKFKKTGPTPAGASGATGPVINGAHVSTAGAEVPEEKQAVAGSGKQAKVNGVKDQPSGDEGNEVGGDYFGGWDSNEDEAIIERARRASMRRKGLNPNADKRKATAKLKRDEEDAPDDSATDEAKRGAAQTEQTETQLTSEVGTTSKNDDKKEKQEQKQIPKADPIKTTTKRTTTRIDVPMHHH